MDVIGIGVQKAATSWLFRCLVEHPEVRGATVESGSDKELNFFNRHWEKGYAWYHRGFEFGPWRTVEFSVLYFHDRDTPGRLRDYNPDAKLLLSLRNPVDRAFSHHKHEVRHGRLPEALYDFSKALPWNPSYVEQGRYATHLARWLEHFDRSQVHVVDYDDVRSDPEGVLRRVFEFVGVDPGFTPSRMDERVFPSRVAKRPAVEKVLDGASRLVRRILGKSGVRALKATGLPGRVREANRTDMDGRLVPPLTAGARRALGRHFEEENRRLGEMLGRDFTKWNPR